MATGELVYEERTPKITPSSSPIATTDGRIYFASPAKSYVIKAGLQFEVLATNDLELGGGSQDYTTPAVADGRINCTVECNPLLGPAAFDAVEAALAGKALPKKTIVKDELFDRVAAKEAIGKRQY